MSNFSFVFLYRWTDFACFTPLVLRLEKIHLLPLCAFIAGYRLNFKYILPCDSTWSQPSMHKQSTSYTCYSFAGGHDQACGSEPGELPHIPGLQRAAIQYGNLPPVGAQVPHHQDPSCAHRKGTGRWDNYVFVPPYISFFCLSPWFPPQFPSIFLVSSLQLWFYLFVVYLVTISVTVIM